ncbi:MAG: cytochrome-c peroxidase [Deltaproteobacteria bacterium]|nr:cytochrome-c peroxidase [Deltaproteobacteria bacterium]
MHTLLALALAASAAAEVPVLSAWEAESPLRPLPEAPLGVPADFGTLPFAVTPEKVRLGRWLFFDARLSADGTISCGSCHRPEHGFSEPTAHSRGIRGQEGGRKAPPILNAAFTIQHAYFWDGRAGSLAEQAKGPIANPIEMGSSHPAVAAAVGAVPGYRKAFREAFGDDQVGIDRIAEAIAAYEATRLSGNSRFDRFQAGDRTALSEEEQRGREIFFGRGRCDRCHGGAGFTDSRFHAIGVGTPGHFTARPGAAPDPGRQAVTGAEADRGAFRTPTLRDVSRRAPYMHDGSAATLFEAVRAYQFQAEGVALDPVMREIDITCPDVDALVAFLGALDGTGFEDRPPRHFPQ